MALALMEAICFAASDTPTWRKQMKIHFLCASIVVSLFNFTAEASTGCLLFNGGYRDPIGAAGSSLGIGFEAGDTITLVVDSVPNGSRIKVRIYTMRFAATIIPPTNAVGTYTYTFPPSTRKSDWISVQASGPIGARWGCIPAGARLSDSANFESQNVRSTQD